VALGRAASCTRCKASQGTLRIDLGGGMCPGVEMGCNKAVVRTG